MRGVVTLVAVIMMGMQAGCGSSGPDVDAHPVSGTVTYKGGPVEGAIVTFVPDSGDNAASGTTDASGKYSLNTLGIAGAAVGSYKVKIVRMQIGNPGAPPMVMGQGDQDPSSYKAECEKDGACASVDPLPEKYSKTKTSELTATVKEGENTVNFELTD